MRSGSRPTCTTSGRGGRSNWHVVPQEYLWSKPSKHAKHTFPRCKGGSTAEQAVLKNSVVRQSAYLHAFWCFSTYWYKYCINSRHSGCMLVYYKLRTESTDAGHNLFQPSGQKVRLGSFGQCMTHLSRVWPGFRFFILNDSISISHCVEGEKRKALTPPTDSMQASQPWSVLWSLLHKNWRGGWTALSTSWTLC